MSYILIEHQSTIDYTMPLRILKYCVAIMEKAMVKEKRGETKIKIPAIYPIVLYTGKSKWKVETSLKKYQDNYLEKEISLINYKLIDINNYTEEELLKEKGAIAKAMLLEKAESKEKTIKIVEKISKQKMSKEEKELIKIILKTLLKKNMEKEQIQEIIGKIEEGGGKEMVIENLQRIWDNSINEGIQKRNRNAE